jgi:GNAT superfamily N-acetyltransferase
MIQVLTMENKADVKALWKENPKSMSIPFEAEIDKCLESGTYYGEYIDNTLVCMGGLRVMKRKPENRVIHLCVKKEYRNQGYGIKLVRHIANKVKELNNGHEFCVYYREGSKNNGFWTKYITEEPLRIEHKTMVTFRGKLDFDKIGE